MKEIKEKLEKIFLVQKKDISFNELVKMLNIKSDEIKHVINALYVLEIEGKIIRSGKESYIHVANDFYLDHGVVYYSSKGNLYLALEHGDIALLEEKEIKDLQPGEMVWFTKIPTGKNKHQFYAQNVKPIRKLKINNNYLTTNTIKKNYSRGFFYIIVDGERVFIPDDYVKGAYDGDKVIVRIYNEGDNIFGKVEKILERKSNKHIFKVVNEKGKLKLKSLLTIDDELDIKLPNDAMEGDFLQYELDGDKYTFIKKITGYDNQIMLYANEFGFETEFNNETLREAKEIEKKGIVPIDYENRVDLRNLTTFTIDSDTAKDLDDAVSIEKKGDNYILYVSIADVSHYVKPGSSLFETAISRTTSVYPPGLVIPMLPSELSNGVCSLNPNEDKLTKTVKIEIDSLGNIVDFEIFKSVINSNMRMTYKCVNELLDGNFLHSNYLPYFKNLIEMKKLSDILQDRRLKRGFICFESNEYDFEMDEEGEVTEVKVDEKGQGQLLIENFMLIANEVVASFINNLGISGSFRNHECPSPDQIGKLRDRLHSITKYVNSLNNISNPKIFQKILLSMFENKSEEEASYISKIMLRGMNRAYYSTNNVGHYGLALEEYATFTSPIRRVSDLLNHLIIEYIIDGRFDELEELTKDYEEYCAHASEKQEDADNFEKNINNILLNKFLIEHVNQELDAKIKFIYKDFIYIKTFSGMCGIIPLSKGMYNNGMVSLNGNHLNVGDIITVSFNYLEDGFEEITFKFIRKNLKINNKKR